MSSERVPEDRRSVMSFWSASLHLIASWLFFFQSLLSSGKREKRKEKWVRLTRFGY